MSAFDPRDASSGDAKKEAWHTVSSPMREQQPSPQIDTEFSVTADRPVTTDIDTIDGIRAAYLELQKKLKRGKKAADEHTIRLTLRGRENLLGAQNELSQWAKVAEQMLPLYTEMEKIGRLSVEDAKRQKDMRLRLASVRTELKDNNTYIKNTERNPKVVNRLHSHALQEDRERTMKKYQEKKSKIIARLSEIDTDAVNKE